MYFDINIISIFYTFYTLSFVSPPNISINFHLYCNTNYFDCLLFLWVIFVRVINFIRFVVNYIYERALPWVNLERNDFLDGKIKCKKIIGAKEKD